MSYCLLDIMHSIYPATHALRGESVLGHLGIFFFFSLITAPRTEKHFVGWCFPPEQPISFRHDSVELLEYMQEINSICIAVQGACI